MSMPEATIDEDCDPPLGKNEIRFSENMSVPSPAGYPAAPKQLHQPQFGVAIPATSNARHHL
jgi:hypothetical protein